MTHMEAKAIPLMIPPHKSHKTYSTYHMWSISHHIMIMSLVINSLAWGRIHTHMHTNTHVHTETILRNQTCASPWDRVLQRMHSELDKCLKGLVRI